MRLTSIGNGNTANISSNRYRSISPSLSVDSRNFPHVLWIDDRNGSYTVNYKFWDGLKWSFIGDTAALLRSSYKSITSQQGLILDENESPIACFSMDNDSGGYICISYGEYTKWRTEKYLVNYAIKWVGITSAFRRYDYSSSGSSSLSFSSQSMTSASSSLESRSSDSYDNQMILVTTVDESNLMRMYVVSNGVLNLIAQKSLIDEWTCLKIRNCGNYIGISFLMSNMIYFDFFDLNTLSFSNSGWNGLTEIEGTINEYDSCGGNVEDGGILQISWSENGETVSSIKSKIVEPNGQQKWSVEQSLSVMSKSNNGIKVAGFSSNVAKRMACCSGANIEELYIVSLGGQNNVFSIIGQSVTTYAAYIDGFNELAPTSISAFVSNGTLFCVFENLSDIYVVFGDIDTSQPSYEYPSFSILSSQRFNSGAVLGNEFYGNEIKCIWDNRTGDILRESKIKVIVTANENNDPLCESSSSSLSSITSRSSASSASTHTYDKVSSSSLDFSSSTEGNSETSEGFTDGPSSGYDYRQMKSQPPVEKSWQGTLFDQILEQDRAYQILMGYISSVESSSDSSAESAESGESS